MRKMNYTKKPHKTYKCEGCKKETSTTNEEIFKNKKCLECRSISSTEKKELKKEVLEYGKKTVKEQKDTRDQSKWTPLEKAFVIIFFIVLIILAILCELGILPGC